MVSAISLAKMPKMTKSKNSRVPPRLASSTMRQPAAPITSRTKTLCLSYRSVRERRKPYALFEGRGSVSSIAYEECDQLGGYSYCATRMDGFQNFHAYQVHSIGRA